MHLFLVANIVTTSKALVTNGDALVSSSKHCYSKALVTNSAALVSSSKHCYY